MLCQVSSSARCFDNDDVASRGTREVGRTESYEIYQPKKRKTTELLQKSQIFTVLQKFWFQISWEVVWYELPPPLPPHAKNNLFQKCPKCFQANHSLLLPLLITQISNRTSEEFSCLWECTDQRELEPWSKNWCTPAIHPHNAPHMFPKFKDNPHHMFSNTGGPKAPL